jgi:hypothetical protein
MKMYQVNSRYLPLNNLAFDSRVLAESYGLGPEDHTFLYWDIASLFSFDDFKEVVAMQKMLSRTIKVDPHLIRENGSGALVVCYDDFVLYSDNILAFARGINDVRGSAFRTMWRDLEFHHRIDWLRECNLDIGIALQDAPDPATCGALALQRPHALA